MTCQPITDGVVCTQVDNKPFARLRKGSGSCADVQTGMDVTAKGKLPLASRQYDYVSNMENLTPDGNVGISGIDICYEPFFANRNKVLSCNVRLRPTGTLCTCNCGLRYFFANSEITAYSGAGCPGPLEVPSQGFVGVPLILFKVASWRTECGVIGPSSWRENYRSAVVFGIFSTDITADSDELCHAFYARHQYWYSAVHWEYSRREGFWFLMNIVDSQDVWLPWENHGAAGWTCRYDPVPSLTVWSDRTLQYFIRQRQGVNPHAAFEGCRGISNCKPAPFLWNWSMNIGGTPDTDPPPTGELSCEELCVCP